MAPKINRDNTVNTVSMENIVPTKNAEYPFCLAIIGRHGDNDAKPVKN